jgi:hypothetical protein
MATFGNTNAETGTAPGFSNYAIVGRFQADGSGTITKLTARLSNDDAGHTTGHVKALVYADGAGPTAGAWIATGDEVTLTDNAAVASVDLPISAPCVSGTWYWLGVWGDAGCDGADFKFGAPGAYEYNADVYASPPPADPFGADGSESALCAVYATYTPTASSANYMTTKRGMW